MDGLKNIDFKGISGFWDTLFPANTASSAGSSDNVKPGLHPISEYKSPGANLEISTNSPSTRAKPYSPYSDIYASPFPKNSDSILDWLSYSGKTQNPVVQTGTPVPTKIMTPPSDYGPTTEKTQTNTFTLCSSGNFKWCILFGVVVVGAVLYNIGRRD